MDWMSLVTVPSNWLADQIAELSRHPITLRDVLAGFAAMALPVHAIVLLWLPPRENESLWRLYLRSWATTGNLVWVALGARTPSEKGNAVSVLATLSFCVVGYMFLCAALGTVLR